MIKSIFIMVFTILIFSGCTGKYVDNELPESDMTKVVIPAKKSIAIKNLYAQRIHVVEETI